MMLSIPYGLDLRDHAARICNERNKIGIKRALRFMRQHAMRIL